MELNRQAKFSLTRRKNLTSLMRLTWEWSGVSDTPVFTRGESLANIYFFKAEISSKICFYCVKHVKHVEKSYWKTDGQ